MRIFALIPALFSLSVFAQAPAGKPIDIGNNKNYIGFEMLDTAVMDSRFIVFGENRDYASFNAKLEFKTLKYLNHRFGLRNYLLSVAPSKAYLVDRFVNTEDTSMETLLKSVSTPKYMKLYRNLKRLNKSLPDSLRIRVFGVDIEKTASLPAVRLASLFPDDHVPARLRIGVEAIEGAASYIISKGLEEYDRQLEKREEFYFEPRPFSVKQSVEEFLSYFDSLKPEFKSWLGNDYDELLTAVGWLREYQQYKKWEETAFEDVWREDRIFTNATRLMDSFPREKFFSMYGRCHLPYQEINGACGMYRFSSLTRRMRNSGNPSYKPLSVAVFYTSGVRLETDMSDEDPKMKDELMVLKESVADKTAVFIRTKDLDDKPLLTANFDFVLINNGYPLALGESDSLETESAPIYYDPAKELTLPGRLFLGVSRTTPGFNISETNRVLGLAGVDSIGSLTALDWQLGVLSSENTLIRFGYGRAGSADETYRGQRWQFSAGGNLLDADRRMRLMAGVNLAYFQNRVTVPGGNTPLTPLKDLKKSTVYDNPMSLMGLFTQAMIDFRFIYISAEAGYNADISDSRWKYRGYHTGDVGRLKGSHFYWSIGAGLSIPLSSGSQAGEEVFK